MPAMQTECFPDAISDWPTGPISVLADVNPRRRVKRDVDYPFVPMSRIGEDFMGVISFDDRRADASGLTKFCARDTLFAKITPCPENGKVAYVEAVPRGDLALGSTEFI